MSTTVIDITRRLQQRRTYDYESGEDAVIAARTRIEEVLAAVDGQLLVGVDDIYPALLEVRSVLTAEATWPQQAHPEAQ